MVSAKEILIVMMVGSFLFGTVFLWLSFIPYGGFYFMLAMGIFMILFSIYLMTGAGEDEDDSAIPCLFIIIGGIMIFWGFDWGIVDPGLPFIPALIPPLSYLISYLSYKGYGYVKDRYPQVTVQKPKQPRREYYPPQSFQDQSSQPPKRKRIRRPSEKRGTTSYPSEIVTANAFRIWWDFENIHLNPTDIRKLIRAIPGLIEGGYSFADPRIMNSAKKKALYDVMVPQMEVPDSRKQASDKVMRTRMRGVHRKVGLVEVVITNDGDFANTIGKWKQWGTFVWVITGKNYSHKLVANASYHSMVKDLIGAVSTSFHWKRGDLRCRFCGYKVRQHWVTCGNCNGPL